jgi:hypothetical protein
MSKKSKTQLLADASATALRELRALDYEVQTEGSEDLVELRLSNVLRALERVASKGGLPSVSSELTAACKILDRDLGKRYEVASDAAPGGLAAQPVLLKAYVELAADEHGYDASDAEVTEDLIAVAKEYDAELRKALDELVKRHPPDATETTAQDLWDADAGYLVLCTLRDEGVGIWAGDWDRFYEDPAKAEEFLKDRLLDFADASGVGKLNLAFEAAAEESCEVADDEDGEDDDEDDDDEVPEA